MTMNPIYAQMGLDVGTGVTSFINQGIASSLAAKLQKYRNRMLEVSAAMNRRVITLNEVATRDASIRMSWELQRTAAQDQGSAEVSAAAAGVQGNNVDATMRGLRSSALGAQAARKSRFRAEMRAHHNERVNLNVGTIMGKDIQVQSRPSMLSAAIGLGATLMDTYDADQPDGDKLGDSFEKTTKSWWE